LQERGADVFEFPTVSFTAPAPESDPPLGDISRFGWIVVTSLNGVETLFDRLRQQGVDARALHGVRLCAISTRAAEALQERGLTPDLTPQRYESDFVANEMARLSGPLDGVPILIPRAEIGRVALLDELRRRGAQVDALDAYRAEIPDTSAEFVDQLERFEPNYVVFNSASAARNLREILGGDRTASLARSAVFAAIGPIAAKEAANVGMAAAIVPERHRVVDLVDAITAYEARR
jgi:uroporphyrinogen III methyltransferase/synthase